MTVRMFHTSDTERSQLTEHKMRPGVLVDPLIEVKRNRTPKGFALRHHYPA